MSQSHLTAVEMLADNSNDTLVNDDGDSDIWKHELDILEEENQEDTQLLPASSERFQHDLPRRKINMTRLSLKHVLLSLLALLVMLILTVACLGDDTWDTDSWSRRIKDLKTAANKNYEASIGSSTCEDPWRTPGYIWYGAHRFDVRWVPYKYLRNDIVVQDGSKTFDPEVYTPPRIGDSHAPEPEQLPPHYTKMFSEKATRRNNSELEFLRNKNIVVLGSSMDREATMMFCNAYEGSEPPKLKWHNSLVCRFPDMNLTISQWMHFGMAETATANQAPWHHGGDKFSNAASFEDRVDQVFKPMAEQYGNPDLLVFTSGLWDLQYLDKHFNRVNHTHSIYKTFQPMRNDQLLWHRARLVQATQYLKNAFPNSFIMYRTTTEPNKARGDGDEEATAVFQLNQSARMLMKKLKVPLLNWSDLVRGNHEHRDEHHFNTISRPNAVYNEMLFWHLKQISEPNVDTSCWLDR